jgi:hypothetical protein
MIVALLPFICSWADSKGRDAKNKAGTELVATRYRKMNRERKYFYTLFYYNLERPPSATPISPIMSNHLRTRQDKDLTYQCGA